MYSSSWLPTPSHVDVSTDCSKIFMGCILLLEKLAQIFRCTVKLSKAVKILIFILVIEILVNYFFTNFNNRETAKGF